MNDLKIESYGESKVRFRAISWGGSKALAAFFGGNWNQIECGPCFISGETPQKDFARFSIMIARCDSAKLEAMFEGKIKIGSTDSSDICTVHVTASLPFEGALLKLVSLAREGYFLSSELISEAIKSAGLIIDGAPGPAVPNAVPRQRVLPRKNAI